LRHTDEVKVFLEYCSELHLTDAVERSNFLIDAPQLLCSEPLITQDFAAAVFRESFELRSAGFLPFGKEPGRGILEGSEFGMIENGRFHLGDRKLNWQ
jgi:hypothetical protein